MGLQTCVIKFDNPYNTYYVGQTVNGRVELTLDKPKKVRGIQIKVKGEADVNWYIEESRTNNEGKTENERIELSGHEEYFKIQYYCLGGNESTSIELPPGNHVYPFTCVLPPTLPSSFEGEYGHIRYTVKVVLDRPWRFDHEVKVAFTVLNPFDLNINPSLKESQKVTLEKFFCCCWCKSGPLTCVVLIPKSGFVPGETIPIIAEVDNISSVEIANVTFQLNKVVSYYSQFPRRETKKNIVTLEEIKVGPVASHGSKTWNQPMVLPPLPPSNLINCSIIDVDYEILVEVCVAGFHANLRGKIPITIGTIPLMPGPTPSAPQMPIDTTINIPPQDNSGDTTHIGWVAGENGGLYPSVPTFGESKFGTQNIQDKDDNQYTRFSNNVQKYNPMYPVYNFVNNTQN